MFTGLFSAKHANDPRKTVPDMSDVTKVNERLENVYFITTCTICNKKEIVASGIPFSLGENEKRTESVAFLSSNR